MLAEERCEEILRIINETGSVTVQKLIGHTGASEATLRRDLNLLAQKGLLVKVHGGAIALEMNSALRDSDVTVRSELNQEEKKQAAKYAASLIGPDDFVFLDAGTTTGYLIDYLKVPADQVVFVTNGIMHARKLAGKGYRVLLPGGELKGLTEALVGEEAIDNLKKYWFTKGFWGTNGIDPSAGFTTPDSREARMKQAAMKQCRKCYVLGDSSKVSAISLVTFGSFSSAEVILAREAGQPLKNFDNVILI